VSLTLKYLAYNFLITYSGIGMSKYICNKISSKLYFLKLLKRAGLSSDDLQYFYVTVIRPISEYACTVWNHNITSTLSDQLESYQKRALRIIYDDQIKGMPYLNMLFLANLESLKDRREKLANPSSRTFFAVTVACILSSHLNVIPNFYVNYATPQNILFPIPELKDTSSS